MSSPTKTRPTRRHSAVDEITPLLGVLAASGAGVTTQSNEEVVIRRASQADANGGNDHEDDEDDEDKPLDVTQILLLCYTRLVEPIAFFSIFPFINQMIFETGNVKESDVGFYSGLIESLFSLTQMTLMITWGRLADRLGRKPILVFSLAGVAIASALFGLSRSIPQMILFRCIAGLFAGTIVTVRTMISEHSTPKTQARAFSLFAFAGNFGIFIGPLIGGALARPAKQFGGVFARVEFWKEYPYALPTIVTGCIGATAAILAALFIRETQDRSESGKAVKQGRKAPLTTRELLTSPGVPVVLFLYGHAMLLAFAYTAIVPVFWFTDVSLGGFGFVPLQISGMLALAGASQALWILLVFPPLQMRFGTIGVLKACYIAWPITFLSCPAANLLLRYDHRTLFWIVTLFSQVIGSGVSMAFTGVQLALNDIAPSPASLGTLNAISLTVTSGLRAFAPALFASLFAVGVREQIVKGYLAWVILIVLTGANFVALRWFPKKAEGRVKRRMEEEE